ncbi:hypothetical protein NFJ02_08g137790 [Pycnococcus provasolii]
MSTRFFASKPRAACLGTRTVAVAICRRRNTHRTATTSRTRASASPPSAPPPPSANHDKVNSIMQRVTRELFLEEAAASAARQTPSPTKRREVIKKQVRRSAEHLDSGTLATLRAYHANLESQATDNEDAAMLADVVAAVVEEVLDVLTEALPAPVAILQSLTDTPDASQRHAMVRAQVDQGKCTLAELHGASRTFAEEFESAAVVPDRAMLAKLALLHAELLSLAAAEPSANPGVNAYPSFAPKTELAFFKELSQLPLETRRRALIQKAFESDWTGAGGGSKDEPNAGTKRRRGLRPISKVTKGSTTEGPSVVRPHRFLETLRMLRAELGVDGTSMRYTERAREAAVAAVEAENPTSSSTEVVADDDGDDDDDDDDDYAAEKARREAEMRMQISKVTEEAMCVLREMAGWQ